MKIDRKRKDLEFKNYYSIYVKLKICLTIEEDSKGESFSVSLEGSLV